MYFVTSVTHQRKPLLVENAELLHTTIKQVQDEFNFEILASVILPEHFHMVIDPLEHDLSSLMRKIKLKFSGRLRHLLDLPSGRIWQNRFWDHIIRDQNDLNRHIDYIHYNPVKHGLADSPFDWQHSSIGEYADQGIYEPDWGTVEIPSFGGEYGE